MMTMRNSLAHLVGLGCRCSLAATPLTSSPLFSSYWAAETDPFVGRELGPEAEAPRLHDLALPDALLSWAGRSTDVRVAGVRDPKNPRNISAVVNGAEQSNEDRRPPETSTRTTSQQDLQPRILTTTEGTPLEELSCYFRLPSDLVDSLVENFPQHEQKFVRTILSRARIFNLEARDKAFLIVPNFMPAEDIGVLDRLGEYFRDQKLRKCTDRSAALDHIHDAYRVEEPLFEQKSKSYFSLLKLAEIVDKVLWAETLAHLERAGKFDLGAAPEIEWILYDTGRKVGEGAPKTAAKERSSEIAKKNRPYTGSHVDNGSVISFVLALRRAGVDFMGGFSQFDMVGDVDAENVELFRAVRGRSVGSVALFRPREDRADAHIIPCLAPLAPFTFPMSCTCPSRPRQELSMATLRGRSSWANRSKRVLQNMRTKRVPAIDRRPAR